MAACTVLLTCSAGCNVIGTAAVVLKGPPTTDAVHTLAKDRATVFFVDDRGSRLPRRSMRMTIASTAGNTLLEKKVLTTVIEPRAGLEAAAGESPSAPMDLVTLTRHARAEIMVYANVREFSLSTDGQSLQPMARLRVKVIDATNDTGRVWPDDPEGFDLRVIAPPTTGQVPRTAAEMMKVQESFAEFIGQSLAKLFYEHETRPSISTK
ncbi:MAG: hypothetical protein HBSAPP03_16870 [Phycisphaerae bacterium]|nr:MAG: hypothetical protein HBSAPP03_16870 [Phycisphaerae bacterium]